MVALLPVIPGTDRQVSKTATKNAALLQNPQRRVINRLKMPTSRADKRDLAYGAVAIRARSKMQALPQIRVSEAIVHPVSDAAPIIEKIVFPLSRDKDVALPPAVPGLEIRIISDESKNPPNDEPEKREVKKLEPLCPADNVSVRAVTPVPATSKAEKFTSQHSSKPHKDKFKSSYSSTGGESIDLSDSKPEYPKKRRSSFSLNRADSLMGLLPREAAVNSSPFFSCCSPEFRSEVSKYCLPLGDNEGVITTAEIIAEAGDSSEATNQIFLVVKGSVEVLIQSVDESEEEEEVVGVIGPGAVFGAPRALGLCESHLTSARTSGRCEILTLSRSNLDTLADSFATDIDRLRNQVEQQLQMRAANVDLLTRKSLFEGTSSRFIRAIGAALKVHVYSRGIDIFQEGEICRELCALISGKIDVLAGKHLIDTVSETGRCFGEDSLICTQQDQVHYFTTLRCHAETETIACTLCRKSFDAVLEKFPEEQKHFLAFARSRDQQIQKCNEALQDVPAFATAKPEFLQFLAMDATFIDLKPEELIEYESDALNLILVVDGTVMCKRSWGLSRRMALGVGQTCGISAVLGLVPSVAVSLEAEAEECRLLKIPRAAVLYALKTYPVQSQSFAELADNSPESAGGLKGCERSLLWMALKEVLQIVDVTQDFANELEQYLKPDLYIDGQPVMEEGASEDFLVVLLRGMVEVSVGGVVVQEVQAPTCLGEVAGLGLSSRRTATVKAKTLCAAKLLYRADFMTCLSNYPEQRVALEQLAEQRMAALKAAMNDEKANDEDSQLSRVNMFKESDPDFLELLEGHLETRTYLPDQKIIQQGDEGSCMYILLHGMADVFVKDQKTSMDQKVGELAKGTAFGEMVFLGEPVRTATIKARNCCVTRVLHNEVVAAALVHFPKEREQIEQLAEARRRVTEAMVGYQDKKKIAPKSINASERAESPNANDVGSPRRSVRQRRSQVSRPSALSFQSSQMDGSQEMSKSALRAVRRSFSKLDPGGADSLGHGQASKLEQGVSDPHGHGQAHDQKSPPDSPRNHSRVASPQEDIKEPRILKNSSSKDSQTITEPTSSKSEGKSGGESDSDAEAQAGAEWEPHDKNPEALSRRPDKPQYCIPQKVQTIRDGRNPPRAPSPKVPAINRSLYSEGRTARHELITTFGKLVGGSPPGSHVWTPRQNIKRPAHAGTSHRTTRHCATLELSQVNGQSEASVFWLGMNHRTDRKLRCQPTYTSPAPKVLPQPPIIAKMEDAPRPDLETHRQLVVARDLTTLATSMLRIHRKARYDESRPNSASPAANHEDMHMLEMAMSNTSGFSSGAPNMTASSGFNLRPLPPLDDAAPK